MKPATKTRKAAPPARLIAAAIAVFSLVVAAVAPTAASAHHDNGNTTVETPVATAGEARWEMGTQPSSRPWRPPAKRSGV